MVILLRFFDPRSLHTWSLDPVVNIAGAVDAGDSVGRFGEGETRKRGNGGGRGRLGLKYQISFALSKCLPFVVRLFVLKPESRQSITRQQPFLLALTTFLLALCLIMAEAMRYCSVRMLFSSEQIRPSKKGKGRKASRTLVAPCLGYEAGRLGTVGRERTLGG
jgi:hypothetical protein